MAETLPVVTVLPAVSFKAVNLAESLLVNRKTSFNREEATLTVILVLAAVAVVVLL
jgi:hypothetical protein